MQTEIMHVDAVEADVECLMCARVIGQLYGYRWRASGDRRTARTIANLTTYRDNEFGASPRRVSPREHFRCPHCGGQGFVDEITSRTMVEQLLGNLCPIHVEMRRSGPGRPPAGCRCEPPRLAAA
jgi:hypothetical protein